MARRARDPNLVYKLRTDLSLEKQLETHDLAIPLPKSREEDFQEVFRLLLVSASDPQNSGAMMARIERLYHQTGGRQVGVIFLLQEHTSTANGTISYMELQASLLPTFEMPIIPLHSLPSGSISFLQATLFAFQRQLVNTQKATSSLMRPANPITTLLPYCTLNPLLAEHSRNVLRDVCHSIQGLGHAATTTDGRVALQNVLPNQATYEDVTGFWEQEFFADK
ncbi:hypothetical protein B0J14DRAFT_485144 [Halenospora varia]|nr:hypothetical protein B0J14DRAFT_485144 [Halenospora varia]